MRVSSLSYQRSLVYVGPVLDDEVSFPTYLGDSIRILVVRQGTAEMTDEQKARARVAARELRLGVSWNFAPVVLAVQQLHHALLQRDLAVLLDSDATLAFRQFLEQRLEDVELALETG